MYLVNGTASFTHLLYTPQTPAFPLGLQLHPYREGGMAEHDPEALQGQLCLSTAPNLPSTPQSMEFRWNNHRSPTLLRAVPFPSACCLLLFTGSGSPASTFLCRLRSAQPWPLQAHLRYRNVSVHISSLALEAAKQMEKQSEECSQNASAPRWYLWSSPG